MRRLLPLMLIVVGACAAPMDRVETRTSMTVTQGDGQYLVRAAYDPIEFAWFARVWSTGNALTDKDRETAVAVIRDHLAPKVCDGGQMELLDGDDWRSLTGGYERFNAATGEWRFAGTCT